MGFTSACEYGVKEHIAEHVITFAPSIIIQMEPMLS